MDVLSGQQMPKVVFITKHRDVFFLVDPSLHLIDNIQKKQVIAAIPIAKKSPNAYFFQLTLSPRRFPSYEELIV